MEHLLNVPPDARALLVLAHGAGAGMRHPFLERAAAALAASRIATYRYEFAYMERHAQRPDSPAVAEARVREAVAEAARAAPGLWSTTATIRSRCRSARARRRRR